MILWHKFIIKCLPFDSMEEFEGASEYHKQEIKIYRRQWQYIVGMVLFFLPAIVILIISNDWYYRIGIVAMFFGLGLMMDAINGHYCVKLYKERGPITGGTNSNHTTGKKLILSRFCLLIFGYVICLNLLSLAISDIFHLSSKSGFSVWGIVLGIPIFNHLANNGKMNWFFEDSKN